VRDGVRAACDIRELTCVMGFYFLCTWNVINEGKQVLSLMLTLRAWSVPSVSKPTPAKMRPCGFVKPTPAGFCSRWGGQFRGNSPGCLGICHAFVTPTQSDEALYAYCYYNHLDSTCVPLTTPRRPSKHGENIGLLCIRGGTLSAQGNLTYQL